MLQDQIISVTPTTSFSLYFWPGSFSAPFLLPSQVAKGEGTAGLGAFDVQLGDVTLSKLQLSLR